MWRKVLSWANVIENFDQYIVELANRINSLEKFQHIPRTELANHISNFLEWYDGQMRAHGSYEEIVNAIIQGVEYELEIDVENFAMYMDELVGE